MSDLLFNVILEAELLPDFETEQVVANLAKLFKLPNDKAAALISSGERVLKQGQLEGAARKYVAALKRAGVNARIEPVIDTDASSTTVTAAQPPDQTAPAKPARDDVAPNYGFTLAPQEGNLLKAAEVPPPPVPPAVNIDNLSLAPAGSDVLETQYRKPSVTPVEPPSNLHIVDPD